jgi:hypothetical protein
MVAQCCNRKIIDDWGHCVAACLTSRGCQTYGMK